MLTVLFSVLMGGMSLGQAAPLLQVCSLTTHRRASAHLQLPSSHCGRPVCISETCHIPHAALHHRQDCWSQGVEGTDQTDRGARPPAVNTNQPTPRWHPPPSGPLPQVINREPQIADASGAEPLQQLRGAIELSDVHFSYPARPDVQIFSGLNLSIAAGQTVALVGESGSGECVVPWWSPLPVTLWNS